MREATDLGAFLSAKTALARAQEINERMEAERTRLSRAINNAVSLVCCILALAAFLAIGGPHLNEHYKTQDMIEQENR